MRRSRIEAPYHALTNAGHITYVELDGDPTREPGRLRAGRPLHEGEAASATAPSTTLWTGTRCAATPASSGTSAPAAAAHEDDVPFERIRRITGYLVGTLDRFNNAKRAEERDRVKHSV